MKSGGHFNQRRQLSVDRDLTTCRASDVVKELEDCALAGPVMTDDAEGFTTRDFEADVINRPEVAGHPRSQHSAQQRISIFRLTIDAVTLRYVVKVDRW